MLLTELILLTELLDWLDLEDSELTLLAELRLEGLLRLLNELADELRLLALLTELMLENDELLIELMLDAELHEEAELEDSELTLLAELRLETEDGLELLMLLADERLLVL